MARPHRLQCGVDGFESGLVAIPYCTKQHTRGRLSTRHKILKDFEISGCRENPYTRRHCPEPPGTLPRAANAQACAVPRMGWRRRIASGFIVMDVHQPDVV